MKNRIKSLAVTGLVLAAAAFAAQTDCLKVVMDKAFILKVGEVGLIEDLNRRIEFREVAEDSRCPKGVDCIWAGNAKVRLYVRDGEKEPVVVELNTAAGNNSANAGGLTISLVSLDPYPVSGTEIASDDYRATLKISKAD